MKKLICFITAFCFIFTLKVSASYQDGISRVNRLVTTGDSTRYSIFVTDGNTITASGFYEGEVVSGFKVVGEFKRSKVEFTPVSDGTYTAVFDGESISPYATIRITLKSGKNITYRVEYDNGWFFGDNGLGDKNTSVADTHTDTHYALTMQYLTGEDGTYEDAVDTLERIKELAAAVTAGIDGDYDKVRAITGWVADNVYYDKDARENEVSLETIALNNVLDTRKTVCVGYANLTAAMIESVGIKAITVIGSALSLSDYDIITTENNHHEWTAFWYAKESRWVMLDSGWDSGNTYEYGQYNAKSAPRKYYDISSLALSQNHRADSAEYRDYFALPEYLLSGAEDTAEVTTTADEPDNTAEPDNTTSRVQNDDRQSTASSKDDESNYLLYYIAVGVLFSGVIGLVCFMLARKK